MPELLARVLAGRGVEANEVAAYLDPSIRTLMPDPHVLTDMEAATARLAHAVIRGESVAIFGDYDVDGATAAALLARYLRHCGLDPIVQYFLIFLIQAAKLCCAAVTKARWNFLCPVKAKRWF